MKGFIGLFFFFSSYFVSAQIDSLPIQTVVQRGHEKPITCGIFSPNNALIATGALDNNVKIWDAKSGYELRTIHAHTSKIVQVLFSPDNTLILSISIDNLLLVHEVITGKLKCEIELEENQFFEAVFSSDGTKIISSNRPSKLMVWDIETSTKINEYSKSYSGALNKSYVSKTSSLVPHVLSRDSIQIVDCITNEVKASFKADYGYNFAFSPSDKYLAVGSEKLITHLFDLEKGTWKQDLISDSLLKCHGCNTEVVYSHSDKYLLSGSKKNGLTLWDVSKGIQKYTIKIENNSSNIEFSSDDKYLLVNFSKELKVYDVKSGSMVYNYKNPYLNDFKPSFSPDKNQILLPTEENSVFVYDLDARKSVKEFKGFLNQEATKGLGLSYSNWVQDDVLHFINMKTSIAVSNDSKWIAKGGIDSSVFLLDVETGRLKKQLVGHSKLVYTLKFSPDGKILATGGGDRFIILWDTETWEEIGRLNRHVEKVFDFAFSPDSQEMISCAWDGYLITWNLKTFKAIDIQSREKTSVYTLDYTPKGLYALTGDLSNNIKLIENDTKEVFRSLVGHKDLLSGIDYGFKNELFTSSWDGTVKGWDLNSGRIKFKHKEHKGAVYSVAFDSVRNRLFSGGADNQIVVWDLDKEIATYKLHGHNNSITSLHLSNNSKLLISSSSDGEIKVWDLELMTELYTFLQIDNKDWLVTNKNGYFDGSSDALKLVTYVKGLQVVPISSLFQKYYTPNLSKRIMKGEIFTSLDPLNNSLDILPKLNVEVNKKENVYVFLDTGVVCKSKFIYFDLNVIAPKPDLHTVRIYKNGKLVNNTYMSKSKNTKEEHVSVYLKDGINKLDFVAINSNGVESEVEHLDVFYDGEKGKTDLFVLSVGINDYKKSAYQLNYAVNDAQSFTKKLNGNDSLFHETKQYLIKDKQATKENIIKILDEIANEIGPEDVFVFFYAGHGVMDKTHKEEQFYLVLQDVVNIYGTGDELKQKAISGNELMEISRKISAEKQLFVLDACNSGGALQAIASRGMEREKALAQLARSTGTFFLTASQDAQYANESKELKHGVFTYSLLEVLDGKQESMALDHKITVNELKTYVEERVPELSKKYQGYIQYPTSYGFGQDFPLMIVK